MRVQQRTLYWARDARSGEGIGYSWGRGKVRFVLLVDAEDANGMETSLGKTSVSEERVVVALCLLISSVVISGVVAIAGAV